MSTADDNKNWFDESKKLRSKCATYRASSQLTFFLDGFRRKKTTK